MANLIVKTGKGTSKQLAAENAGIDFELVKYDSTAAFKKAAEEDNFDLEGFAKSQIKSRAKDVAGVGFAITKVSGKADTRERPYDEEVVITKSARKYKTTYAIVKGLERGTTDLTNGTIVGFAEDKSAARKQAKLFVTENKERVDIFPMKLVSEGEAVAAHVDYAPSAGTTEGEYVFFMLAA